MSLKSNPIVSVVLPTYNGSSFIASAIKSVQSQTWADWELLVIDDGSSDNTVAIVSEFSNSDQRIRYIRNEYNIGIQKTLNKGLALANGNFIARIDDDDVWSDPMKIEKQVSLFTADPELVLVGTGVIVVDENGKRIAQHLLPATDVAIRDRMLFKNPFIHSSVLFKKEAGRALGGYAEDQSKRHVEDYDLWLRMGTVGKFANLEEYAVTFLQRSGSVSSKNKAAQFRKNIVLVLNHRYTYPHFFLALVFCIFRFFIYRLVSLLPFRKTIIRTLYKLQLKF